MEKIEKIKGLGVSLFALRIGIFIVMFMWTVDKFVNPGHTAAVFKRFYMIDGLGVNIAYAIGTLQLLLVLGFVTGIKKRFTYGVIFIIHSLSTLSTWGKIIDPWGPHNLLFYTAIPMLAAIFALYRLRDYDDFLVLNLSKK